ncbi:MAG: hypothetical protein WCJ30_07400, partial [Deltaproteobacteria bacterium]
MDASGTNALPAFAEAGVENRVLALCGARWMSPALSGFMAAGLFAAIAGTAVAYAAPLHHAAEAWVALITR